MIRQPLLRKSATAATLALLASAAFAQEAPSGISLYGVADVAAARASNINGGPVKVLSSGRFMASRLGFRGRENLGGGLAGIFTLEHGLELDLGVPTSATFYNRQSFVGLSSASLGTVTLGLQYTPLYDFLILLSGAPTFGVAGGAVDGVALPGSSAGRFDNTIAGSRITNTIKYVTPTWSGVRAEAMVSAAEGSTTVGRVTSLAAGYNSGAISSGVGLLRTKCPVGCTGTADQNQVLAAGFGYDFGAAKFALSASQQKNARGVRGNDANVLGVLVQVPVGAWQFNMGYQTLNDKSALNQDIGQVNASAFYNLTRRTMLYAIVNDQKVDNNGKASMAVTNSTTGKQTQTALGLRHLF